MLSELAYPSAIKVRTGLEAGMCSFNRNSPPRLLSSVLNAGPDLLTDWHVCLQDKKEGVIVSNESSDILKFLAMHFKTPATARPCPDYYPEPKRSEIDRISECIISDLGKRVYMCAFAKSQASLATHR